MNREQLTKNREQITGNKVKKYRLFSFFIPHCYLLFFICSLLFVSGCRIPFDPPKPAKNAAGTGTFSLILEGANSRTILPNTPSLDDFAVYTLVFTPVVDGAALTVDRTNENLLNPINLEAGTYDVQITAYLDAEKTKPAGTGRLDRIVINAGAGVTRSVTLRALVDSGTGRFSWDIEFPEDLSEANMTIKPLTVAGTAEQTLYFAGVEDRTPQTGTSGSLDLNSGYYRLIFTLAKPGTQRIEWREMLHIYQNLESVFAFTFTEEHFNNTLYTVTFVYNDGITPDGEQTRSHGEQATEPSEPVRDGYFFDGWYGDSELIAVYNFDTPVTGNITLHAKWYPAWNYNQWYTVTFDPDGGRPTPAEQIVIHGGTATRPADMEKSSFAFIDWYSDSDLTAVYDFDTPVTGDITLYAKWIVEAFLVYDVPTLQKVGTGIDGWTLSAHYRQIVDIDLNNVPNIRPPIGDYDNPFTGTYDGGDYTISNLSINTTAYPNLIGTGLFGVIDTDGVVKNINLINVDIKGGMFVGGMVGYILSGAVENNCSVTGNVSGYLWVGGVVGYNKGTVKNSYTTANVSGTGYIGGVVGESTNTVENCYATGNVLATATGQYAGHAGGVVGYQGMVKNCYATGTVTGNAIVGGVVGGSITHVENCVAFTPSVTALDNAFGRVGSSFVGWQNNYARNDMTLAYNGITYFPTSDANGRDGADITATDWNNAAWWENTAQFDPDVWDLTVVGDDRLPILKNVGGVQNPTVQYLTPISVTGVTLNTNSLELNVPKAMATLYARVQPANATNKAVTWSSNNTAIVTVNPSGMVTAVAPGTATITVTTVDGAYTAMCAVTVLEPTEIVTYTNLNDNDIYLIKVNTSGSVVNAANTGSALVLSRNLQSNGVSSFSSDEILPRMGHPAAEEFNANPPPIPAQAPRRLRDAFIAPVVGDTRMFWVETFINNGTFIEKEATLMATGLHGNIWVMDNSINTASAQELSDKFDIIYPAATNILGYEYGGGPGGDGGRDGDPKIQILVYIIDASAGISGFFWAKDFYPNRGSNMAEIFYLNRTWVNLTPEYVYSTLIHELQHMINFNEKYVKRGKNSATWYDEMLSMMTEDVIADLIGLAPTNRYHRIQQRMPDFLRSYAQIGITEWGGGLNSYAKGFAFGAYLLRNYGGAALLKEILANNVTDEASITAALSALNTGVTFEEALTRFGEAMIYSGPQKPAGKLTFDKTVTSVINDFTYTAHGFDIWSMAQSIGSIRCGPVIFDLTPRYMRPHSITVHQVNEWKNISGDFSVTLERPVDPNVVLYFLVKIGGRLLKLLFLFLFSILAAYNLFSLGEKEEMNGSENSPTVNVETGSQPDAVAGNITKITGKIQIYGNEPHTFVGIVDENGAEYAVYPPSREEDLRTLQGHLIEFTVIVLDEPQGYGSLFLKGGTVTPVKWEIIQ